MEPKGKLSSLAAAASRGQPREGGRDVLHNFSERPASPCLQRRYPSPVLVLNGACWITEGWPPTLQHTPAYRHSTVLVIMPAVHCKWIACGPSFRPGGYANGSICTPNSFHPHSMTNAGDAGRALLLCGRQALPVLLTGMCLSVADAAADGVAFCRTFSLLDHRCTTCSQV